MTEGEKGKLASRAGGAACCRGLHGDAFCTCRRDFPQDSSMRLFLCAGLCGRRRHLWPGRVIGFM